MGVGAALALMGGALPTAWAEPEQESTNQDAIAQAVDTGGVGSGDNLLVTIPGNHNKVMPTGRPNAPKQH